MGRGQREKGRGKREDGRPDRLHGSGPRFPFDLLRLTSYRSSMTARAIWLVACSLSIAFAVQAADPFYLRLLREGTDSYNRRDFVSAVRQLRTACFGLLDEPETLADGLVRLGLAQASAGDTKGFAETFQRLAEVEERFGSYGRAAIPGDVRGAFEQLVLKLIPRSTLTERPAIARLMPSAEEGKAKTPPGSARKTVTPTPAVSARARPATALVPTRSAVPAPIRMEIATATAATPISTPTSTTPPTRTAAPSRTPIATATAVPATATPTFTTRPTRPGVPSRATAAPTPTVPVGAPSLVAPSPTQTAAQAPAVIRTPLPVAAAVPSGAGPADPSGSLTSPPPIVLSTPAAVAKEAAKRAPTAGEQRELNAIQELVRQNKIGDALHRAQQLADAQPDLPEAQFVAAELAYRTLRWPEAVAYFRRGGDPGDARPLLLFYEAVSLYEAGDQVGAAAVLKRALPNIRRTSYVESYIQKILRPGAAATHKP